MPVGLDPEIATVFPPSFTTGGLVPQLVVEVLVQNAVPVMSNLVGTPVDE